MLEVAVGGMGVLGSQRERPELVPSPSLPGSVTERARRLERHPDGLDERHPAHEERQESRQGSGEAKDVVVTTFAVEPLENAEQHVDLFEDDPSVDPALGDSCEELERPLDSAGDAGGLLERLLRYGEGFWRARLA